MAPQDRGRSFLSCKRPTDDGADEGWRINRGAPLPDGLVLVEDRRPGHKGHFMLAPKQEMPLKKYLGLLEELGMNRGWVQLVSTQEIQNAKR